MPKGYPNSTTCKQCGYWCPNEWSFCPICGEELHKQKKDKTNKSSGKKVD